MLTSRTGRWSMATALLCVVLLAASWFLLIGPRRADAADLRGQTTAADSQASTLQLQIAQLRAQFADLPARKLELASIKSQLPPRADMPDLVRRLQALAAEAGVSLDSVAPGTPAVVGSADAATAGAGSLVAVPVAISVTGDYFEVSLFVKNLQLKLRRSYLVTGLTGAPAPEPVTVPTPTPTPTSTPTPSAGATAVPTPSVPITPTVASTPDGGTGSAATDDLDRMALTLNGSVFVLLDGTVTLDDVTKDVAAAQGSAPGATPSPSAGVPTPTATAGAPSSATGTQTN